MTVKSIFTVLGAASLLISTPAYADSTKDVILGILGGVVINEIVSDRNRDRDRDYRDREYRDRDYRYYGRNQSYGYAPDAPYDYRGVYIPSPAPRPESRRCWTTRTYDRRGGTAVWQHCD